jgi:hypothetical protein
MDYKSKEELLSTNPTGEVTGTGIDPEKRKKVVELLLQGKTNDQVAEEAGVSKPVVIAIKKHEIANGFSVNEWKRGISTALASIVSKGAERLSVEIDRIPAGQLPLAIAILTDKILALQDAPTTIIEHRLRISHEDINKMIKGEVIDLNNTVDNKVNVLDNKTNKNDLQV